MEAGGVAMASEIKLISASAGSGKTYRLMELVHEEVNNGLKANGLLAVTYTKKAAEARVVSPTRALRFNFIFFSF